MGISLCEKEFLPKKGPRQLIIKKIRGIYFCKLKNVPKHIYS